MARAIYEPDLVYVEHGLDLARAIYEPDLVYVEHGLDFWMTKLILAFSV